MPNWCENKFKVSCLNDSEEAKIQLDIFKSIAPNNNDEGSEGYSDLSLNSFVRIPETLKITSGSIDCVYEAYYGDLKRALDNKLVKEYIQNNDLEETRENVGEALEKLFNYKKEDADIRKYNIDNYGHMNWYSWNVANWGTKWDVIAMLVEEGSNSITYDFETAWSPPIKFVEKVSNIFPLLEFNLEFREEGMGFEGHFYGNKEEGFQFITWEVGGEEEGL